MIKTYINALRLLGPEKWLATFLVLANIGLGLIQLIEPVLLGKLIDALSSGLATNHLIAWWAGLGFFGSLAGVLVSITADRLAHRLRLSVLAMGFEKLMMITNRKQGESGATVRILLAGSDALFWMWLTFLREHLAAIVTIVCLVPTAVSMDYQLTLVLGILAIFYTIANIFVVNKSMSGQEAVEQYNSGVFGRVGDVIGNIMVVQGYNLIQQELSSLKSLMQDLLAVQYPVLNWWAILTVLTRGAATLAMVAIFAIGAQFASRGQISLGEIVSFVGFATLLIGKLDHLSSFTVRMFSQMPTIRSFIALLDNDEHELSREQKPDLIVTRGHVRFENVSFYYPGTDQGVVDLDFEVNPGETMALVGKTGSGKTTTLMLLERIIEPESGRILIDGQDISKVNLSSLRHVIAIVFQEVGLFNRSIQENILVGKPNATEAQIHEAARRAEAEEFILDKQGTYDFKIGEQGSNLSGGERQRLAIARALLKQSPFLLLDEATSALDVTTEAKIQRALGQLKKGKTTFIVAHSLSTIANADRILVLEHGRIIQQGNFETLVNSDGIFSEMLRQCGSNHLKDQSKVPIRA